MSGSGKKEEMDRVKEILDKQRKRNRRRDHIKCGIVLAAGILIGSAGFVGGVERVMADGDTYIKPEYVRYCEEIGEQHSIAPELLEALIETESAGEHDVISRTGDVGLCQINPRWVEYTADELKDPYTNISCAADILEGLFEKYGLEGLMAYNAGEYSDSFNKHMEDGTLSDYAKKIIKRSDYLQELHHES